VLERRLAAARDKGRDEGRAELAEQLAGERAALAKAAQALAKALARLQQPSAEQVAVLSQAVDAAVIRLASERAGCAIERAPAGFAQRVSRLAERLAGHAGAVTVRLHPADLAAIRPFLGEAMPHDLASLAAARLVADPALQRGDADVASADVRLADLLDPTIPGDIA
jgi:flagellar biosynthesis/type III secretory pathway protein FliH